MAKVMFGGGNVRQVSFNRLRRVDTPIGPLNQKAVDRLIQGSLDVVQYFPQQYLEKMGAEIAKGLAEPGPTNAGELTRQGRTMLGRLSKDPVNDILRAYYSFYAAMLRAMDDLLKSPGIPIQAKVYETKKVLSKVVIDEETGKRRLEKRTKSEKKVIQRTSRDVRYDRKVSLQVPGRKNPVVHLRGTWAGLADSTIKKKLSIYEEYKTQRRNWNPADDGIVGPVPTFWRHTGRGRAAFHSAVRARLASLDAKDFLQSVEKKSARVVPGSLPVSTTTRGGRFSANAKIAQVAYEVKFGIPRWNQKLDLLTSVPFASGLRPALAASFSNLLWAKFNQAGDETRPDLRGIDRLLAAEIYRPWLMALAEQAGRELQAYVSGQAVTAVSNSGLAARLSQAAQQKAAVRKKAEKVVAPKAPKATKPTKPVKARKVIDRLQDSKAEVFSDPNNPITKGAALFLNRPLVTTKKKR